MARVAIVGVGAIGGVIAAMLKMNGQHEIVLCTRRPLDRLEIETPDGTVSVNETTVSNPELVNAVDWVFFATKTYDITGASTWLRNLCREDTAVAILQNGVEHREHFAHYVDADKIVPVIIDCPAERYGVGRVRQRGDASMQVENSLLGNAFIQLFKGTRAMVEATDDFPTAAWKKLCVNSIGALSALVMKPAGVLRKPAMGQIALNIVSECIAVGRAEGARLADEIGVQILERCRTQPPDSVNSMLADRIAGRAIEIESRNGVIVRKGRKHGITTPTNEMIVALLNASTEMSQ